MRNEPLVGTMAVMETVYARRASLSPRDVGDQVVVMRNVSWDQYETILAIRGERPKPRLAYLDGALEIMTTSADHEITKKVIARLVEAFAEAAGLRFDGAGQTTLRKEAKRGGLEPEECYYLRSVELVGVESEDLPPPDLAIEVVHSHGGIDKLEIYRRLGVREVWFLIDSHFWVYTLDVDGYEESNRSQLMPECDLDEIARLVVTCDDQTAMVRAYREAVRARLSGGTRPNS
jgi:Uma2 family endonuclease